LGATNDINKKGLVAVAINPLIIFKLLVPRDRIELPTRGFSDQYRENSLAFLFFYHFDWSAIFDFRFLSIL